MPVDCTTAFRSYDLPSEGALAHTFLLNQIKSAKSCIRLCMFGFTDAALADALASAHERGVDLKCLFDHTQSTGPKEVALLHRFWLRVPPSLSRITTSPEHQFMHRKSLTIDADAQVADAQYISVDEATAQNYPRVITGSTNYSPTAFLQNNDLICVPGKAYAAQCVKQFDALWAWADTHEQAYQPGVAA